MFFKFSNRVQPKNLEYYDSYIDLNGKGFSFLFQIYLFFNLGNKIDNFEKLLDL